MCLRRVWPRWREALVLVQPATVARWDRRGLPGWWSARSRRRLGRPRIESDVRNLIRRMRTENCLWGAPRIHGEWLKLGIAVSERTVSRYRPDRTRGRSQTWRPFLRNHVGAISCHAVGASSARPGDEDVVDTGLFSRGLTPPSGTAERLQPHGDCRRRPLGSTHVSWLAGCLGPTSPPGGDRPVPAAIRHGHVPLRRANTRTRGDSFIRL